MTVLSLEGSIKADGENARHAARAEKGYSIAPGGGSGGTILLFLRYLVLGESSVLSSGGGSGSPTGSGGGGGGRIHFHWSKIPTGDIYQPIASVKGLIYARSVYHAFALTSISLSSIGCIICSSSLSYLQKRLRK